MHSMNFHSEYKVFRVSKVLDLTGVTVFILIHDLIFLPDNISYLFGIVHVYIVIT